MKLLKVYGRFGLLSAILLSTCGTTLAGAITDNKVAWTFSKQFETVFRADGALLRGSGTYQGLSQQTSDSLRVPFIYLKVGLEAISTQVSDEVLQGSEVIFVGAKNFQSPSGLGSVRSTFCFGIVLREKRTQLRQYFHTLPLEGTNETAIWRWQAHLKEYGENDPRPSVLFAANPSSSMILVSNDLTEIKETMHLLIAPEETIASPVGWDLVKSHSYWGLRHYRHSIANDRNAAGLTDVAEDAEALIYRLNGTEQTATLILFTSPGDKTTAPGLTRSTPLPPLKPVPESSGRWEISFSLSDVQGSVEKLFVVMGYFGFGIYS